MVLKRTFVQRRRRRRRHQQYKVELKLTKNFTLTCPCLKERVTGYSFFYFQKFFGEKN